MDLRYSREVAVGTLVIAAVLIFVFGTMWLSGRTPTGDLVWVRFENAAGLKRAAPVRVSGVPIGKVEQIEFVDVGNVRVGLGLPERITPKVDAKATIVSISLVGDYAVDFDPGKAQQALPEGRVIIGTQEEGLSGTAEVLGEKAETLMTNLQLFVNERTANNLNQSLEALQQTMTTMNRQIPATTAELNRTMVAFRQLTGRLDQTLNQPGLQRAIAGSDTLTRNLSEMSARLAATSARLDSVMQLVQHGEGTLGKLASDSMLYRNITNVTASLDSLLVALKQNPGRMNINPTIRIF
jgi:phospholipid/cholesterol/gamma-HCH transport system substrate-binding protein